jgi:hypothetical protein
VLAGSFFAFSYLTRPEGFLLFALVLAFLFFLRLISRLTVPYKQLALLLLVFSVLSFPYLLYLRTTIGQWTLSGKVLYSWKYRAPMLQVIQNDDWTAFHDLHYAFDREKLEMADTFWGFYKSTEAVERTTKAKMVGNAAQNLGLYGIVPKTLFSWYLAVFSAVGILAAVTRIIRKKSTLKDLLLLFFPFSLFISVLSYPIPRHHLFLVPVFCLYAVEGMVVLLSYLPKRLSRFRTAAAIAICLFMVVFIVLDYRKMGSKNSLRLDHFAQLQVAECAASEFLKMKKARVIMSEFPGAAVRAGSDWQVLPDASEADRARFARKKNVDYIALPVWVDEHYIYRLIDIKKSYIHATEDNRMVLRIEKRGGLFERAFYIEMLEE